MASPLTKMGYVQSVDIRKLDSVFSHLGGRGVASSSFAYKYRPIWLKLDSSDHFILFNYSLRDYYYKKEKSMKNLQKPISFLFLIYFVVLFIERAQSLYRSYSLSRKEMFASSFDIYVNVVTMVSLLSFLVLICFCNKGFWVSLVSKEAKVNYSMLTLTAGVILVSGMVHTEYTIPGIQFASYGALIIAMVLKTIEKNGMDGDNILMWYSLIYSVMFSMAIPVVYKSNIDNKTLFHVIEAVVSLSLVVAFTYMLRSVFFKKAENLMFVVPFLIMAIGDALIVAMRWKESVNGFVLIFASISSLMFIAGRILVQFRR